MNCLVIGGGGFIGSHLAESLLLEKHNVSILDYSNAHYLDILKQKGAKILFGDFIDPIIMKKSLFGIDIVYHLASTTVPSTSNSDPIFDIQSNLVSTINMFSSAKECGIKKIIFASSGGTVYGIPKKIPISESHPTNPISSYGIVKLAIEKYAYLFWKQYGLEYSILRIANAYGARQKPIGTQGIIPNIIINGLQNKEIQIWGNGSAIRDYLYVTDIIDAFLKITSKTTKQKIFNVGSGVGISVNDIISLIKNKLQIDLQIIYEQKKKYDVPVNILSNSLSKKILNWQPKINIDTGITKTIDYLKDYLRNK